MQERSQHLLNHKSVEQFCLINRLATNKRAKYHPAVRCQQAVVSNPTEEQYASRIQLSASQDKALQLTFPAGSGFLWGKVFLRTAATLVSTLLSF